MVTLMAGFGILMSVHTHSAISYDLMKLKALFFPKVSADDSVGCSEPGKIYMTQ